MIQRVPMGSRIPAQNDTNSVTLQLPSHNRDKLETKEIVQCSSIYINSVLMPTRISNFTTFFFLTHRALR